jgi:hypothetical protein
MARHRQLSRSIVILLGAFLLGPLAAEAQRSAMPSAARVSAVHTHTASAGIATTTRSGGRTSTVPRWRVHSRGSRSDIISSGALNPFSFNGAAGVGFADSGLSNEDLGIKAAIDPATQWRLYEARRYLRSQGLSGGGYFLLDGGAYYAIPSDSDDSDQAAQDQQPQSQQPIIVQAPQSEQSDEGAPQAEQEEASESLPDVGQFVLVLRNGTEIEAVAFTRMNDRIVYITEDGSRRTVALGDLNSDETERVNQERGTPLQLPM